MTPRPELDDVLSSYAAEPTTGRETLERYVRRYPQFASQLVDLSRELARVRPDEEHLLSTQDHEAIAASWSAFSSAVGGAPDVFDALPVSELARIATALTVPRQVLTAIKERRVTYSTFPHRFLHRLADALGRAFDDVCATLSLPKAVGARSFKSDEKPVHSTDTVPFEQVLKDAGVSGDKLAELLADDD